MWVRWPRVVSIVLTVHLAWWAAFFAAMFRGDTVSDAFWLAVAAGLVAVPLMSVAIMWLWPRP